MKFIKARVKHGLVARKSPFGWVIFGATTQSSSSEAKQVLDVRFATHQWISANSEKPNRWEYLFLQEQAEQKIIEESCTLENKRWTVKYPWKKNPKDLPNNYAQVVKRMESTERRLLSNPDHAKSYNRPIKEMEEMEFSRKLTKKE